MTGTEVALVITACGTLITALGQMYNVFNIRRLEKNTNSISARNEAIAKQLGISEGKASEKANPSPRTESADEH